MPKLDVVEMYKKGYSIDYIIETYYRYLTRNDEPNRKHGNVVIIKKKTITRDETKKRVYNEIFNYVK